VMTGEMTDEGRNEPCSSTTCSASEDDIYNPTEVGAILRELNHRAYLCIRRNEVGEAQRIADVSTGLLLALREYEKDFNYSEQNA